MSRMRRVLVGLEANKPTSLSYLKDVHTEQRHFFAALRNATSSVGVTRYNSVKLKTVRCKHSNSSKQSVADSGPSYHIKTSHIDSLGDQSTPDTGFGPRITYSPWRKD